MTIEDTENPTVTKHIFKGEHEVRSVMLDGDPWFIAHDVCKVLGLSLASGTFQHLRKLDKDEKQLLTRKSSTNLFCGVLAGRLAAVSEGGLYKLLQRSDKPEAKVFQRWVNHEVLPSIRRTGGYLLDEGQTIPLPTSLAASLRQQAALMLKLATSEEVAEREKSAHAETDAARMVALEKALVSERAKNKAMAEVARLAPIAAVADAHFSTSADFSLTRFARTLRGVNTNMIKKDLAKLRYLHVVGGCYRVYSRHRDVLFSEKRSYTNPDTMDIFLTVKGQKVVTQLRNDGLLTMKVAYNNPA